MNKLLIYPTSRAAREKRLSLSPAQSLQTTVTTIAEFEQKVIYVPGKTFIDATKRSLFFNERVDASLFTKTEIIFKLFEELAYEKITFEQLLDFDTYANYEKQILQLRQTYNEYRAYLQKHGYTDKAFVPGEYSCNSAFYNEYDQIELFLDGYLTAFEKELFATVARQVRFLVHMELDRFIEKNSTAFTQNPLQSGYFYTLDLAKGSVVARRPLQGTPNAEVTAVSSRIEQAAFVFDSIETMITRDRIAAEDIAVILPDEAYKTVLQTFDRKNNLNFAMGFDYTRSPYYQKLDALYTYMQTRREEDAALLQAYKIQPPSNAGKVTPEQFFERIDAVIKPDEEADGARFYLQKAYRGYRLQLLEFLYLYVKELQSIRVDDTSGGKITVMGALESRGSSFEGVIIVDFNDRFVPKVNQKDIYLNSALKASLGLPTARQRQNLQKHLYFSLLQKSKSAKICFSTDDAKSSFLNELGLDEHTNAVYDQSFFFHKHSLPEQPQLRLDFDPKSFVWSATMLKSYLSCPVQFYYKYIKKILQPKDDEINEGDILHRALAQCEDFTPETIERHLAPRSPNSFYTKLWMTKLQKFIAFEQDRDIEVVAKESSAQKVLQGITFRGRADRIDIDSTGRHWLIDYKTGSVNNPVYNLDKMTDFQMPLYSLLFSGYDPVPAYLPLFAPKLVTVKAMEQKMELFDKVLENLAAATKLTVTKCEDEKQCVYCPYKLLCARDMYR
ncbi:MAG: PD-(D/E)XK nuclease family protein [Campylobacterota bacterium]